MRSVPIVVLILGLWSGTLLAQQPAASTPEQTATPPTSATNALPVAPGSVIPVQLSKTIDAKKAKSGDEVVAKVTQDLANNAGVVLIPKDTKVIGHVTVVEASSKEKKESQVGIAFDRMAMKNGAATLPMSIQAIIAPPSPNPATAGGGYGQPVPAPGGEPNGMPSSGGGQPGNNGSMVGTRTTPNAPVGGSDATGNVPPPAISGKTEGVVGIPNLKLSAAPDAAQGSLVISDKNNVKLSDGTFLLLRVNPTTPQ